MRSFRADALSERCVLVTGASSGLGTAIARAVHDAGATVALTARRRDRLDALAAPLDRAVALPCDLTDCAALAEMVGAARAAMGRIDVLINAAGTGTSGAAAQDETPEEIDGVLAVNLVAPLLASQLVYAEMRARGSGVIVNVGSIAGMVGVGRFPQASYAASKGGIHALTRELAAQWSRFGIRVNCLVPGFFESELTAGMYAAEKSRRWIGDGLMLQRHAGPADLADAAVFLASDASAYMTGQTLVIDGGWTAR